MFIVIHVLNCDLNMLNKYVVNVYRIARQIHCSNSFSKLLSRLKFV